MLRRRAKGATQHKRVPFHSQVLVLMNVMMEWMMMVCSVMVARSVHFRSVVWNCVFMGGCVHVLVISMMMTAYSVRNQSQTYIFTIALML